MSLQEKMDTIRKDIEEFGHKVSVTNIWNIKKHDTKMPLNMFFIELKLENNNKDIYTRTKSHMCTVT